MTSEIWGMVAPRLPENWKNAALRQGWPDVAEGGSIAIDELEDSWLCRAPILVRDRTYEWFFFCWKNEILCFRILNESHAGIEFVDKEPAATEYEDFKSAVTEAFLTYGFCGVRTSRVFAPTFPSLKLGAAL
ncbi:hypothetical protein [Roseateles sp. DXS20W]